MKKSFFIIIVALIMSATVAFGQSNDNLNSLPEYDYVYITFTNMGNLPATGNIHVQWEHPYDSYAWGVPAPRWSVADFQYTDAVNNTGSNKYDSQNFWLHDWIKIIVTVSFSDGTTVIKMKMCPNCDHFYFDGNDFVIGATTTPNIIETY
jgi:ABC-type transport system involved in multi-copper enzyme maturation permease subunit